jgi:predicted CXXCH cytochrome family protein
MKTKGLWAVVAGLAVMAGFAGSGYAQQQSGAALLPVARGTHAVSAPQGASYIGSQACAACHQKDHQAWKDTWHANMHRTASAAIITADFSGREIGYKDIEIEGPDKKKSKISPTVRVNQVGDRFSFTLIDRDNPANNQTYDIAYVFGGNWNQHFEAQVGAALYPTPMRWIVEDKQWTAKPFNDFWWVADGTPDGRPRRPEEMPKTKTGDATCDGCHTTGFSAAKDKETGRWLGKKIELGIGCEACHGPGSKHAASKKKSDILNPAKLNAQQQDQLCGQCHSRVTNRQEKELSFPLGFQPGNTDLGQRVKFWTYSSNGKNFWANGFSSKNRQQFHDVQLSGHTKAGVTCISCHDVHSSRTGYAQLRLEKNKLCIQCHKASAALYQGSTMAKSGVTCVSCHMAKIANRSDATAKSKNHWDVSSHTFAAVLPATADSLKMKSSCDACHEGAEKNAKGTSLSKGQAEVRIRIARVESALASSKDSVKVKKAGKLLAAVKEDRSFGAHNPQKALELLDRALKIVAQN